jgi:nucleotide-binding universal stress UspA family protein
MKVLLAIDASRFSEAATQAVIQQLRPEDAEVYILHVVKTLVSIAPFPYAGEPDMIEAAQQEMLKEGRILVERAEQLLRKAGYKVQTSVEEGEPRSSILDYAKRCNADLILVGSHGRKGLDRFLLGSVAESVARHARCSVEIVRTPTNL